jgi:phospholipase C
LKTKLFAACGLVATAAIAAVVGLGGASADNTSANVPTATPIKHVVVIFDENESFDHYYGTYPNAANPPGEPEFHAKPGTPSVNGLTSTLLTANPNKHNPQRLDRAQPITCSNSHSYDTEQEAFDGGNMDKFEDFTAGSCHDLDSTPNPNDGPLDPSIVMDYYDGNTVTGLWNLAQNFALNDNSYSSNFGPSTVGALNLVSGQTNGAIPAGAPNTENGTVTGDPDPSKALDDCASGTVSMTGPNVGDLLNAKSIPWGWFQGGFRPSSVDQTTGKATCGTRHNNVGGSSVVDYSAHHEPFEYYPSTANVHHTPPSSPDKIGLADGPVNHQYDLADFDTTLANDALPAVTFLKATASEDGHPSNSDPLDEQRFIARSINALEASPEWASTAVILAYDDSDGWYDHQMSPIISPSAASKDQLNGPGICGTVKDPTAPQDRCGYGPRQPLLVISPYAKQNYVDSTLTDQASILRFIEDNWSLGRIDPTNHQSFDERAGSLDNMFDFAAGPIAPKVFLDPDTGEVTRTEQMPGAPQPTNGGGVITKTVTVPAADPAPAPDPTPAASAPAPTTTPTKSTPSAPPIRRPQISYKATGTGRKVTVTIKATGGSGERTTVRARLARSGKQIATASKAISHGRATITLKPRKAVQRGHYVVTLTISSAGLPARATHRTVTLG